MVGTRSRGPQGRAGDASDPGHVPLGPEGEGRPTEREGEEGKGRNCAAGGPWGSREGSRELWGLLQGAWAHPTAKAVAETVGSPTSRDN